MVAWRVKVWTDCDGQEAPPIVADDATKEIIYSTAITVETRNCSGRERLVTGDTVSRLMHRQNSGRRGDVLDAQERRRHFVTA